MPTIVTAAKLVLGNVLGKLGKKNQKLISLSSIFTFYIMNSWEMPRLVTCEVINAQTLGHPGSWMQWRGLGVLLMLASVFLAFVHLLLPKCTCPVCSPLLGPSHDQIPGPGEREKLSILNMCTKARAVWGAFALQ